MQQITLYFIYSYTLSGCVDGWIKDFSYLHYTKQMLFQGHILKKIFFFPKMMLLGEKLYIPLVLGKWEIDIQKKNICRH